MRRRSFKAHDYMIKNSASAEGGDGVVSIHDITRAVLDRVSMDSALRDLHEPSIGEIAKYYGIDLSEL